MDQKTPDHITLDHITPDRKKPQKPTIAIRVLKAPLRAMFKIRDLYVSSMYSCAAGMGGASSNTNPYTVPRSYSTSSSRADDDFAELIRIASTRSLENKLDPEFLRRQQSVGTPPVVPRSQSVAIGRIDENSACDDFGDDFRLNPELMPRSRSHAVTRMNVHR